MNSNLEEIKSASARTAASAIKSSKKGEVFAVIIDGAATKSMVIAAEAAGVKAIVAKNFSTTDTSVELLSF